MEGNGGLLATSLELVGRLIVMIHNALSTTSPSHQSPVNLVYHIPMQTVYRVGIFSPSIRSPSPRKHASRIWPLLLFPSTTALFHFLLVIGISNYVSGFQETRLEQGRT